MKKHFKKRLAAFKVGLVLSIMITPFCFYKLLDTVQAAGNVITYNSYGSTERGVVNVAYNGTTYMTDSYIRFNFNGVYNGIVGINLSGASPLSNLAVVPDNCHIISTSTNYIQIEFYGVNQCEVHFTGWQALVGNFDIQSVIWNSMTFLGHSDSASLINITNRLTDLKTYTDGIEGLFATNNQLLQTIATNTANSSGGSSTVNNIDINVDHIADELSLLKTSNDSILDELLGFFSDGLGHVLTIDSVVDAIEDTTTALIGVQNQLTGIGTTLNSINTTLSQINQSVSNIDNSIDTITWNNRNIVTYKYLSGDGTFKNVTDNNYSGINNLLTLNINFATINRGTNNYISKIRLGDNVQFTDYFEVTDMYYLINNSKVHIDYYQQNNNEITLYVYNYNLTNNNHSTAPLYIEVKIPRNKYLTIYPNNASCGYIFDNDIEYWTLIQCFNDYKSQRQILEALNNLSINVHGDIVEQTEQVINNYDTDFTTIHNIENNFTNNFDSTNPGVISLLNSNLQIPQGFIEGSNFIKLLFPKIVDNSSLVGFPYFLILAIVVLIVLLG